MHNALVPRTSGGPINRLSSIFDDFFAPLASPAWTTLPLSMWEDENHVYVEVDAPGLTEKDIELSVHDGMLTLRGERKWERKDNLYNDRIYGRFEQRVTLPTDVDADNVEAKLTNGVLSVTFPKSPESKPRKISVKAE